MNKLRVLKRPCLFLWRKKRRAFLKEDLYYKFCFQMEFFHFFNEMDFYLETLFEILNNYSINGCKKSGYGNIHQCMIYGLVCSSSYTSHTILKYAIRIQCLGSHTERKLCQIKFLYYGKYLMIKSKLRAT